MLQLGLHLRANPHQLVAMNQQLPQILLFPGRSPDPRKPSLQQQLQNQRGVASVVLLLPHLRSANLRRIADPNIVSCRRGHFHKPLAVPGRLHSNQSWPRQSTVKLLRFSRRMLQFLFSGLSSRRVQPTNLLPTGVVITSNKHHRRLLPTEFASVLQPEAYSATERSLRSYPINPGAGGSPWAGRLRRSPRSSPGTRADWTSSPWGRIAPFGTAGGTVHRGVAGSPWVVCSSRRRKLFHGRRIGSTSS